MALRERGALRDTMVFAVGNPNSPLVLVGEAPGAEEEKLGEPFVGPAGQLLTKMITAMGLERSQVYITNIVKYRPAIEGGEQGSKNRRPTADEIAAGLPHLRRELALLRPRVLVALGATALEGLAGEPLPIGRARGQWRTFEGIPLMPTFHPSYLLHNESLAERRKVWEDLLQVMEKLGLPISAKQRAFFKG
jgi:DNA polymerase